MSAATPPPIPQSDPLAQLRDIHLPEPISLWPPAPGWWLLLGLLIILALLGWLIYRQYLRGANKRLALTELERITQQQQEGALQLQQLSKLLRWSALATHPRHQVAGLQDQAWLAFLNRFVSGEPFTQGHGQQLARGPYQKIPDSFDGQQLSQLCRECIIGMFKQGSRHV